MRGSSEACSMMMLTQKAQLIECPSDICKLLTTAS